MATALAATCGRERVMAEWKTVTHLEDHFDLHGRELRCRTVEALDASAQETIALGTRFTYRDRITSLYRTGFFHRQSARFVSLDDDGLIVTHFRADEAYVADLPYSTYTDVEV
jgi:hypothetical protein